MTINEVELNKKRE